VYLGRVGLLGYPKVSHRFCANHTGGPEGKWGGGIQAVTFPSLALALIRPLLECLFSLQCGVQLPDGVFFWYIR